MSLEMFAVLIAVRHYLSCPSVRPTRFLASGYTDIALNPIGMYSHRPLTVLLDKD